MKAGDKFKHVYYDISIELVSETEKGWKVMQVDGTINKKNNKAVTKFYGTSEIKGLFNPQQI